MDPELVRSQLGGSQFPSDYDKELLDSVGNKGMLISLFAMLGPAMAVSWRLMGSTVEMTEIQLLENQVEGLMREKKELSDTLTKKLDEMRNLESDLCREKTIVRLAEEKLKEVEDQYKSQFEKFENDRCSQLKTIEHKVKKLQDELEKNKKKSRSC